VKTPLQKLVRKIQKESKEKEKCVNQSKCLQRIKTKRYFIDNTAIYSKRCQERCKTKITNLKDILILHIKVKDRRKELVHMEKNH
jgi:hypothetical protein